VKTAYGWYHYSPTEYGVETTDELADEVRVFDRFEDARAALIRSLIVDRQACQEAVNNARRLRKSEVSL
jgi:hypothetical protein